MQLHYDIAHAHFTHFLKLTCSFNDEVQIMLDLQHQHIIHLHELYKNSEYFFLVMEKLNGGELFDRLCQKEVFTEKEARDTMRTILDAIAYCHDQGIAHRDLKPENLLLTSLDDDAKVKIADFGFAKRVPRPCSLSTRCGSPAYMAPELVNYKMYDERVDNWSIGVIIYTILGGFNPFARDTVHLTLQEIRQANYQFEKEYWNGISPDAKRFVTALLTLDPNERITAEEALLHPWMTGKGDDLKQNKIDLDQFKEFNGERKQHSNTKSFSVYWLVARR